MTEKPDNDSLQPDKGRTIQERPQSEPLIKSDVPDFNFTPSPPPEPPKEDSASDGGDKE